MLVHVVPQQLFPLPIDRLPQDLVQLSGLHFGQKLRQVVFGGLFQRFQLGRSSPLIMK